MWLFKLSRAFVRVCILHFAHRLVNNHYATEHTYIQCSKRTSTTGWLGALKPESYSLVEANPSAGCCIKEYLSVLKMWLFSIHECKFEDVTTKPGFVMNISSHTWLCDELFIKSDPRLYIQFVRFQVGSEYQCAFYWMLN